MRFGRGLGDGWTLEPRRVSREEGNKLVRVEVGNAIMYRKCRDSRSESKPFEVTSTTGIQDVHYFPKTLPGAS